MRWVAWIVAPLIGLAGAIAAGWLFSEQSFSYLWGVVLAPAVTLAYAKTRHIPPARTWGCAAISLIVTLLAVALALGLFLLTLDFSDMD